MIALDSSVFVAIAKEEHGYERYEKIMLSSVCIVGAPTLQEVHSVLRKNVAFDPLSFIDEYIGLPSIIITPFGRDQFYASRKAFDRYGKGRGHPAQLNFGDCLSYAVAKVAGAPLLFIGNEFTHTDVTPALQP